MAMGAFWPLHAGRIELPPSAEADIEPFRGMLLGLFFMSVGMSIDLALVGRQWRLLAIAAPSVIVAKTIIIAIPSRLFGATWRDGLRSGLPAGGLARVRPWQPGSHMAQAEAQLVTALAAITMLLGPIASTLSEKALAPGRRAPYGTERCATGKRIGKPRFVIGFGRFGQIVNQALLAQGIDATVIDKDVERIRDAGLFGLKVYFGDGARIDVLRAGSRESRNDLRLHGRRPANHDRSSRSSMKISETPVLRCAPMTGSTRSIS